MNCSRLSGPLVNGPLQFSRMITCVGKYRTRSHTLLYNPSSVRSYNTGYKILESFRSRLRKGIQRHGSAVFCACSQQAQYIIAHRVWRGQQASVLYLKLWGGGAFTALVSQVVMRVLTSLGHCIKSKYNSLLLSCSGLSVYDWKKNRIPTSELIKYINDIEAAVCLKKRTIDSGKTTVTARCTCKHANHSKFEREDDPWSIFLEFRELLVWKREIPQHRGNGLYEYKVYGLYNDVTAMDFMATNIDTTYRKMWDSAAVVLEVLETQPSTNSDVIYWEVAWPKLMNNRDYVYQRRYMVDRRRKVVVIINQNTAHPLVPEKPGKERVSEYWSIIVIKPITELNEPGIEFTMTYFDNPGSNVPASISQWASATAFPDFHRKLRDASKVYSSKRKEIESFALAEQRRQVSVKTFTDSGKLVDKETQTEKDKEDAKTPKTAPEIAVEEPPNVKVSTEITKSQIDYRTRQAESTTVQAVPSVKEKQEQLISEETKTSEEETTEKLKKKEGSELSTEDKSSEDLEEKSDKGKLDEKLDEKVLKARKRINDIMWAFERLGPS